jgi:protein disulfide-isomerase A6
MKGTVKVAYWDTEQGANPPRLIGQIKGTPTIKFIYPNNKKNKANSNKKKIVVDYQQARELKPMMEFAEAKMPNYVEKIKGVKKLDKFIAKADKYGLPKALLFTKLGKTSSSLKALSTEYRRRMLIGEVRGGKHNKEVFKRYNIKNMPACIVLGEDGEEHQVFDKKPTFNRLNMWFKHLALKKPYFKDEVAQARITARKGAKEDATTKKETTKKETTKETTKKKTTKKEKETGFKEEL